MSATCLKSCGSTRLARPGLHKARVDAMLRTCPGRPSRYPLERERLRFHARFLSPPPSPQPHVLVVSKAMPRRVLVVTRAMPRRVWFSTLGILLARPAGGPDRYAWRYHRVWDVPTFIFMRTGGHMVRDCDTCTDASPVPHYQRWSLDIKEPVIFHAQAWDCALAWQMFRWVGV